MKELMKQIVEASNEINKNNKVDTSKARIIFSLDGESLIDMPLE